MARSRHYIKGVYQIFFWDPRKFGCCFLSVGNQETNPALWVHIPILTTEPTAHHGRVPGRQALGGHLAARSARFFLLESAAPVPNPDVQYMTRPGGMWLWVKTNGTILGQVHPPF